MRLDVCLGEIQRQATGLQPKRLNSLVAVRWVRQALVRTGVQTIRRRKLSNEAVVWLVIGMALFRHWSIDAVVKHLGLARGQGSAAGSPSGSRISSAAVARGRDRVGCEAPKEV